MSENDTAVLWQRVDEHTKQINNLTVEQKLDRAMIDRLFDEGRRRDQELAEQHTTILETVNEYGKKVDKVLADHHRREGARDQKTMSAGEIRLIIMAISAVCTIIGTIYLFF